MSKERALRRAEREREAATRAARRAAEVDRAVRRRRRGVAPAMLQRFRRRLQFRHRRRPEGVLARKRRNQNRLVLGLAVVVQLFGWLAFGSVRGSIALLVLSAFALPVLLTLAFDRRG